MVYAREQFEETAVLPVAALAGVSAAAPSAGAAARETIHRLIVSRSLREARNREMDGDREANNPGGSLLAVGR
jgi:hypothetical protein